MAELIEHGMFNAAARQLSRSQSDQGLWTRPQAPQPSHSPRLTALARTIEADVIPRLFMAHRETREVAAHRRLPADAAARITSFADLILGPDHDDVNGLVEAERARAVPLEDVYLGLLAPTAKYLRHMWTTDLCDFADMTLGLWRLQQILRDFAPAFRGDSLDRPLGLRALLSPGPEEKRDLGYLMFGLVLAGEFFRRDSWETWLEPDPASKPFAETIRGQWFDVVEFFASGEKRLDALASCISMVRRESLNPHVGIMLCGPAFIEHPEFVVLVGGDVNVTDLRQETTQAQDVINLLASHR